jgi:hypothetical protein
MICRAVARPMHQIMHSHVQLRARAKDCMQLTFRIGGMRRRDITTSVNAEHVSNNARDQDAFFH